MSWKFILIKLKVNLKMFIKNKTWKSKMLKQARLINILIRKKNRKSMYLMRTLQSIANFRARTLRKKIKMIGSKAIAWWTGKVKNLIKLIIKAHKVCIKSLLAVTLTLIIRERLKIMKLKIPIRKKTKIILPTKSLKCTKTNNKRHK